MTDDPIDLRLRAALRHAPDGEVAPPTLLDLRIKAAARQALATPQRRSWRDWLDRLLQPPAAAALATLALGTVIGVMWQCQVPPESMPGTPSASADLPAVVARTAPEASPAAPPQLGAAVPPPASPAALPPPKLKPAAPVSVAPPTAVAEAKRAAAVEPHNSMPPATPETPAPAVAATPAPTPPPTPTPAPPPPPPPPTQAQAAAAGPARTGAENEVAGLVSPPAAPPPNEPAAAAAAPRPAAQATTAARLRSESRAAADSAGLPDRLGASAAPLLPPSVQPSRQPPPPPVAELATAAAGPWQRVASNQMPEGGSLIRDADGQVLGRMLVQRDWLWWQPWVNGQPAPQAQRAAARGAASAPQP